MAADGRHGICANLRHLRLTQEPVHRARQAPESSKQLSANHRAMHQHAVILSKAVCEVCLSRHVGFDIGNGCDHPAEQLTLAQLNNGGSRARVHRIVLQYV